MIDRLKLLDAVLDNQNSEESVLIQTIENVISEGIGFDHSAKNLIDACKLNEAKLEYINFDINRSESISKLVESVEKCKTKRECVTLLVMVASELTNKNKYK